MNCGGGGGGGARVLEGGKSTMTMGLQLGFLEGGGGGGGGGGLFRSCSATPGGGGTTVLGRWILTLGIHSLLIFCSWVREEAEGGIGEGLLGRSANKLGGVVGLPIDGVDTRGCKNRSKQNYILPINENMKKRDIS